MMKKIVSLVLAICLLIPCSNVFAFDEKLIITDVDFYKANIYICDPERAEVVLVNVRPLNMSAPLTLAQEIEYRAIPIEPTMIFGEKGNNLTFEVVNGYLLDSEVVVMVAQNGYGRKVMYMTFKNLTKGVIL